MKETAKDLIHRDMTIEEILGGFPQKSQKLAQEITNAGLHCVGCQAATWETLEAGMLGHGFPEEAIDRLVQRLNDVLSEPVDLSTIRMTSRAAEKYKQILTEDGKAGWGLRFGDKAAGCSGFEYVLDYSEKAKSDDETFHSNGVEIHVNRQMASRLLGSEIDYVDGLNGSGFKITNPNAKGSCGCGKSQSY
ncbi:MAG: iron-sulfur cluster assembly accessory protein [Chlamydiales bacterium]|nr:iron-sulfur cluster assembly accessory protein [Chlamydiales bacterium]